MPKDLSIEKCTGTLESAIGRWRLTSNTRLLFTAKSSFPNAALDWQQNLPGWANHPWVCVFRNGRGFLHDADLVQTCSVEYCTTWTSNQQESYFFYSNLWTYNPVQLQGYCWKPINIWSQCRVNCIQWNDASVRIYDVMQLLPYVQCLTTIVHFE